MKMKKKNQRADASKEKARIERAEARAARAEARIEQVKTRAEAAETRTEQAETRTEQAKTRIEQAETRTEQAETRVEQVKMVLEHVVKKEPELRQEIPTRLLKNISADSGGDQKNQIKDLTERQREILQLIASGQNTKQIADLLKVSPKTVEYHRMTLMKRLNIHDIPGLVRFAMHSGLLPLEKLAVS